MSEPTYSNDPSDLEENKPLTSTSDLRAFDGIASSPTPRGGLLNTPSLRSCCLLSSQPCRRLGSSYIYNDHIYRTKKTCIVGPHFPATLFIVLFISGATWFFGFVTPRVLTLDILGKETPSFVFHQCVCLGFWVLCNYLLMKTACTDPGIMLGPTELPPQIANDESEYSKWRFCQKCEIYQGPLTAHCNDCKCCIDELDHHCPWMGKCVGRGNMRWFKLFNLSWVVYFLYAIVTTFV